MVSYKNNFYMDNFANLSAQVFHISCFRSSLVHDWSASQDRREGEETLCLSEGPGEQRGDSGGGNGSPSSLFSLLHNAHTTLDNTGSFHDYQVT